MQPVLTMVVFTVVFGKVAKLPSGGTPYALLTFAAELPWQSFSNGLTAGSNSIANAAHGAEGVLPAPHHPPERLLERQP